MQQKHMQIHTKVIWKQTTPSLSPSCAILRPYTPVKPVRKHIYAKVSCHSQVRIILCRHWTLWMFLSGRKKLRQEFRFSPPVWVLPIARSTEGVVRGRGVSFSFRPSHSSAFLDGVVGGLWCRLQGLPGRVLFQVSRPLLFTFVVHNGLPVFVQVGVLTARQLEEGGQPVQICHFVEGAQQEVHHHQTHEQVDWGGGEAETQGVTGGHLFNSTMS